MADFEKWIAMGAPDPRDAPMEAVAESSGPKAKSLEEGRKFWVFHPLASPQLPEVTDEKWVKDELDRFVLARLEERTETRSACRQVDFAPPALFRPDRTSP